MSMIGVSALDADIEATLFREREQKTAVEVWRNERQRSAAQAVCQSLNLVSISGKRRHNSDKPAFGHCPWNILFSEWHTEARLQTIDKEHHQHRYIILMHNNQSKHADADDKI